MRISRTPLKRIRKAVIASSLPGTPVLWLLSDGQWKRTFRNWGETQQFSIKDEAETWLLNKKIEYNDEVWMNAFVTTVDVEEVFVR